MPESEILTKIRKTCKIASEWKLRVTLEPDQLAYLIQQIDQERADKQSWLEAYQEKFRYYNEIIDTAIKALTEIKEKSSTPPNTWQVMADDAIKKIDAMVYANLMK